jgi:hypothetical protein
MGVGEDAEAGAGGVGEDHGRTLLAMREGPG